MINSANDVSTCHASSGETELAVSSLPYTSHGCRPVSASTQPAMIAIGPAAATRRKVDAA
jgi:hypothetical protein